MKPDVLIIGAGLYGATAAALLKRAGKRVLVLERREHIAGNCFDEVREGQRVCAYGAHVFHTNDERVWRFVQQFGAWQSVTHRKYARIGDTLYAFPINLMTLHQLWGVTTPAEAEAELVRRCQRQPNPTANLEAWCLHLIGPELYELFIKGYTEKMWGRPCTELPHTIVARVPIRSNYEDRYFSDRWEAVPTEGYTALIGAMLDGCEVRTGVDWLKDRADYGADLTIYTGPIDALYDYRYGKLDYRSLDFEWTEQSGDIQGALTVNYPELHVPHIRTEEYAHLWRGAGGWLCTTTPQAFDDPSRDALYPVQDAESMERLSKYRALQDDRLIIGGRLGEYRYYNMDQAIASAMKTVRGIIC